MFTNLTDFTDFKNICIKESIEYHTYTINTEKTTTAVLKGLIKLPGERIINSIKDQGLKPLHCIEIPTHTKFPDIPSNIRIRDLNSTNKSHTIHRKYQNILGKIWIEKTRCTMFPLSSPWTYVGKLQQKSSLCKMCRTIWLQKLFQNSRNSTHLCKLQRKPFSKLLTMSSDINLLRKKKRKKKHLYQQDTNTCPTIFQPQQFPSLPQIKSPLIFSPT